jgi:hypothetical protein
MGAACCKPEVSWTLLERGRAALLSVWSIIDTRDPHHTPTRNALLTHRPSTLMAKSTCSTSISYAQSARALLERWVPLLTPQRSGPGGWSPYQAFDFGLRGRD